MSLARRRLVCWLLLSALGLAPLAAQSSDELRRPSRIRVDVTPELFGGTPVGEATPEVLSLSLVEALERGMRHNLGALLARNEVERQRSFARRAHSALLPELSLAVRQSRGDFNLGATSFRDFPGVADVVGPFDVFDARVSLDQTIWDQSALRRRRAEGRELTAQLEREAGIRALVVLAISNRYQEALAQESHVASVKAQVATSAALWELAKTRKRAGLVPEIDVLRSELRLQRDRQRLVTVRGSLDRAYLALARSIGLPLGQSFELTDELLYAPVTGLTLDNALSRAYASRADLAGQEALVDAARAARSAASAARLPQLRLRADYGEIGADVGTAKPTFDVAALLEVPLLDGGRRASERAKAEAELSRREAQLADMRAAVYYDVRYAFLDLAEADDGVQLARRATEVAQRQLEHARGRFAAGVTNNVEVIQAQEDVARSEEVFIDSLMRHSLARGAIARAIGLRERELLVLLSDEERWQSPAEVLSGDGATTSFVTTDVEGQ